MEYTIVWVCDYEEESYSSISEYHARVMVLENMGYVSGIDFF